MENTKENLTIYAHGMCQGKDGGWGNIIISQVKRDGGMVNVQNEMFGAQEKTNAKAMELQAVVKALDGLNESKIMFYTTSKYVLAGVKDFDKPQADNQQLWNILRGVCLQHEITWKAKPENAEAQKRVEQLCKQGIASCMHNDEQEEYDAA